MLSSALTAARSGLAAESLRVEVAARNIANASTEGYVPQRVVQTALTDAGGVSAVVRPVAGPQLYTAGSQVDIVKETTTLIQAEAAYKANLAVIATVDDMTDSLLELFDNDQSERDRA